METAVRKPDMDLEDALTYNPQDSFSVADIQDVLAEVPGEADGPDWFWVVQLKPRRFALIQAGCDYTGWD